MLPVTFIVIPFFFSENFAEKPQHLTPCTRVTFIRMNRCYKTEALLFEKQQGSTFFRMNSSHMYQSVSSIENIIWI